ncbi:MAG: hypothetical protein U0105_27395 [Candidatus Obscuribacterales bacterium]
MAPEEDYSSHLLEVMFSQKHPVEANRGAYYPQTDLCWNCVNLCTFRFCETVAWFVFYYLLYRQRAFNPDHGFDLADAWGGQQRGSGSSYLAQPPTHLSSLLGFHQTGPLACGQTQSLPRVLDAGYAQLNHHLSGHQ